MSRYIDYGLIGGLVDVHGNVHYEDIKNIPTADVRENVRGEWVCIAGGSKISGYYCSCCYFPEETEFNYCPRCGADMRGGNDE